MIQYRLDLPSYPGRSPLFGFRGIGGKAFKFRAWFTGECIVEFTGVDVCRIEVAELYVEESIQ